MITFLMSFGLVAKVVAGIGAVGSTLGGLAWLGWLGPLGPVVAAIGQLLKTVVKILWDAFQTACSHPAVWALVFLGYVGGRWHQHGIEHWKINEARSATTVLEQKVKGASDVEAAKVKAAIAAREAAKELLPLTVLSVAPPATAPAARAPDAAKPDGVREPPNKVRRRPKCESLFCP